MLGKHLLGIYEKAMCSEEDFALILSKAKKLGFDYVEMSIDESDERIERLYWNKNRVEKFRENMYLLDIPVRSICLSAHRRFPFGSPDSATRIKAFEIMERAIEFAAATGIRVIQLAGYDVFYEESSSETVKLFKEGLKWAMEVASAKQVMLAMEVMDTPFVNSVSKALEFKKLANTPWYGIYPDLGNLSAWPENNIEQELNNGVEHFTAIHLKDTIAVSEDFPGKFKKVKFGEGCVDFRKCFWLLENLGYTGPYLMEMWAEGDNDVEEILNAKQWIEQQYNAAVKYKGYKL